jgi:hypothetical protein
LLLLRDDENSGDMLRDLHIGSNGVNNHDTKSN